MSTDKTNVENYEFEPIKGYPMLNWKGKRPFRSTQYFPAQLKEVYGQEDDSGWINKIFWGDNLQVMSHLLKEFRGKVDLIYIDPPFDSKADYKKTIQLKGKNLLNDSSSFEEKQYTDIWSNDEYLQFIYERLLLAKELLSSNGNIFVHCDYHKNHLLRCLLDEVFGKGGSALGSMTKLSASFDTIFWYAKGGNYTLNPVYAKAPQEYIDKQFKFNHPDGRRYMATVMRSPSLRPNLMYDYKGYKMPPNGWAIPLETMKSLDANGYLHFPDTQTKQIYKKIYLDEYKGQMINTFWSDISTLKGSNREIENYPTQKPIALIDRIIELASNTGDLVFDFFMGSGSTLVSAEQKNRRFIGADINRGALVTTTKRLSKISANFEHLVVNNYEVFRNPIEAKDLLIEALEIQKLDSNTIYDGEKDGYKVKIMPVNRIATKEDLNDLIANFPYKQFESRKEANPNQPVEDIMLVCMGHEPSLGAILENESGYKLKVKVVDILRDKSDLTFKYDSEAAIKIENGKLVVDAFYPLNLLQKLSQQKDDVTEWREMVESIMIDWNYDGAVMEPIVIDIPSKDEFVLGEYDIPEGASKIKIKITDLLSESYEEVIVHG